MNAPPLTGAFQEHLGYTIERGEDGIPEIRLLVRDIHLNQFAVAHGGVALSLLDTIGGVTLRAADEGIGRMATISMSCNFLLGVEPGVVIARARIDRIGAAVGSTTMTLHAGDKLLATAQAAYRLFRD